MHAQPAGKLAGTPRGREAQELLARCVHCGFCLPACPTYRVTGNELDSPRGRIYLVKQLVENAPVSGATLEHLDRCLTCRSCETACPSGVQYGRIVELGREVAEARIARPPAGRARRYALAQILGRRRLFSFMARVGRLLRPLLPPTLRIKLRNADVTTLPMPAASTRPRHSRRVMLLEGCVQPTLAPEINAATSRVLDRLGISVVRVRDDGCCGALAHHLGRTDAALDQARRNLNAWDAALAGGASAIVSTASACGLMVKDYERLLAVDAACAHAAQRVSRAARDLSELFEPADLARAGLTPGSGPRVAWQAPCTLQHGQRITGRVEALLVAAGYRVVPTRDAHQCCGSAGTYSILQPDLSRELRRRKLEALVAGEPACIATANIGCLMHLRESSAVPVKHWIELVDAALRG